LKYRVQNNVFVVEKLKKVQKSNFLKILCRALCENARQTYMFVVRQMETMHFFTAHGQGDEHANGVNGRWEKMFVVRHIKTHGKLFIYRAFFFAVHRGKCARQSPSLPCARRYAHGKD
jgi:hypothetical protein